MKTTDKKRLQWVWSGMRQRCYNQNTHGYKWYGGKGIKVCQEWIESSSPFIKWAMKNGYRRGLEIDRIDSDGDYSPNNCRFVTRRENLRNRKLVAIKNGCQFRGVTFHNKRNKYYAQYIFYADKKCKGKYLGTFSNRLDAAVKWDSHIINNRIDRPLNFPQPISTIITVRQNED